MKEHSAAQRMERDKDVPQRSQSSAASLTSLGADISPSSSQFFEVIIFVFLSNNEKYKCLLLHIESLIYDDIPWQQKFI